MTTDTTEAPEAGAFVTVPVRVQVGTLDYLQRIGQAADVQADTVAAVMLALYIDAMRATDDRTIDAAALLEGDNNGTEAGASPAE